ncbi:MAG: hypothetical protein L6Q29_02495 [Candidatus Pacebacteria bacterium]|nr:hypothetical protein [Candidatus Paceibacterota bacterium]NUQ57418.1 hypothetical protein [Candidatus Paceibacter sp.]
MKIPIAVVQRDRENLAGIKNCVKKLNPSLAEEIFYTNNPDRVLWFAENKDTLFVVSGQIFVPEECGGSSICRGTHLARLVKKKCEKAFFFIYSTMPEMNEYVDGVISKEYGTIISGEHGHLAEILCHLDTFVSNLKDQDVKNILRGMGKEFCELKRELNSVLFGAE